MADSHTSLPKILVAVALGGCIFGAGIATLIVRSNFGGSASGAPAHVSLASSRSVGSSAGVTEMKASGMMDQGTGSMMGTTTPGSMNKACTTMMGHANGSMMGGTMKAACNAMMARGMGSMMGMMGADMMSHSSGLMMAAGMTSSVR